MDDSLHWKREHRAPARRTSFDSPCSLLRRNKKLFRCAEISAPCCVSMPRWQPVPSCAYCIPALIRRLTQAAPKQSRLHEPVGQHVREHDDAPPYLEPCHILCPTDLAPLEQLQMMRFNGESWELFGPVMSGEKNS
jgi:hypothetical protein